MDIVDLKIRVTLKSDLCVGKGEGFSSIIDTDVCHDKGGLPYIPARRLKGAFLDVARYIKIDTSDISKIFGLSGEGKSGALRLGSARLGISGDAQNASTQSYDILGSDGTCVSEVSEPLFLSGDPQKRYAILSLFTNIKAQTAIEGDSAKKESLRFTRTVNRYSPIHAEGEKFKEQMFFADCSINRRYLPQLINTCKATRNIGLNRTRGLGAVKIDVLCRQNDDISSEGHGAEKQRVFVLSDDKKYRLPFQITLIDPLMLSSTDNMKTENYISGTAIKGALASDYLASPGGCATSEDFETIFLSDEVIFGNAYIAGATPAAQYLMEEKQTGEIQAFPDMSSGTWKVLRNKYAIVSGVQASKCSPDTEIAYHHRRDEEAILYTQERLCEGQVFSGEIVGEGRYLNILMPHLAKGIRLGRSKSAEYSLCEVQIGTADESLTYEIERGEKYILTLESDLVALDNYGNCIANQEALLGWIQDEFKIEVLDNTESIQDQSVRSLSPVRIVGYSGIWNMKRPHTLGIKAGSYICFSAGADGCIPRYIGERISDGFGKINVQKLGDVIKIKVPKDEEGNEGGKSLPIGQKKEFSPDVSKLLDNRVEEETARMKAIEYAEKNEAKLKRLGASFVGRVHLMIDQAEDFGDLRKRIKSIKSAGKRDEVLAITNKFSKDAEWREELEIVFTMAKYYIKKSTIESIAVQSREGGVANEEQ